MRSFLEDDQRGKTGVYIAHNPDTGHAYIGSGILGRRYTSHLYLLKNNKHFNPKFQEAYNANPNFDFVGVVVDGGRDAALDVEQVLLDSEFGNPFLLNVAIDVRATRLGTSHGDETREKISKIKEAQWQDPAHREKVIAAQAAGKAAMSEEARNARAEKIGESLKVLYETGQRVSTKGQTRSDEFKQQNSNNIKNLWSNPEYRAKQMAARAASRAK